MNLINVRAALGVLVVSSALLLNGCFGGGLGNFNLSDSKLTFATLAVSPMPVTIAAGTSQTFTAAITNAGSGAQVTWSLDTNGAGSAAAVGTLSATSGNTVTYTAPSTPPVYSGGTAGYFPSLMAGSVVITVQVTPTNGSLGATTLVEFVITAPSVTVGLAPTTASVALGATQYFYGYSVGSATRGLTWQVDGVTGGSLSDGTITPNTIYPNNSLYTAPVIMPMKGPNVTVTMISVADPTKTQTAIVTLH